MLPAFLTAFFFSCSTISAGRSSGLLGGASAHFYRLLVAIAVLALYALLLGQGVQGGGFTLFLMSGAIGIGIGDCATFYALPRIGPRLCALLVQCLCAPFAACVEWFWMGTALTGQQMLGSAIILAGSGLSLLPGASVPGRVSSLDPKQTRRLVLGGVSLTIAAAFAQAVGAVLTRKAFEVNQAAGIGIDGMTAAFQRICGAVLVMAVIYYLIQSITLRNAAVVTPAEKRGRLKKAAPWVVINAFCGMVFGVACFQWALQNSPTAIVLSIVALSPLLVIPLSWLINRDRPPMISIFGGMIAVSGVLVLLWS